MPNARTSAKEPKRNIPSLPAIQVLIMSPRSKTKKAMSDMKTLTKIATPPSLGIGVLCTFLSLGLSIAPTLLANSMTKGVDARDSEIDDMNAAIRGIIICHSLPSFS
jgi:hypothetical protein